MKKQDIKNVFGLRKAARPPLLLLLLLPATLLFAPIFTRLAPSDRRVLESAGATLLSATPATVNGAAATLNTYAYPAPPETAAAEAARLLGKNTGLIVMPGADPGQSVLLATHYEAAPGSRRAVAFPKGLPHPDNATPTFSASLDATQTAFAAAVSTASPEMLHADMRRRLTAQNWVPAMPASVAGGLAIYARGNAAFLVFTTPDADGATRLALLQRLTSN